MEANIQQQFDQECINWDSMFYWSDWSTRKNPTDFDVNPDFFSGTGELAFFPEMSWQCIDTRQEIIPVISWLSPISIMRLEFVFKIIRWNVLTF